MKNADATADGTIADAITAHEEKTRPAPKQSSPPLLQRQILPPPKKAARRSVPPVTDTRDPTAAEEVAATAVAADTAETVEMALPPPRKTPKK